MADIRVERFDVDVGADGSTHTLASTANATSAMLVRNVNSSSKTSAGPTGSTGNTGPHIVGCGVEVTDTSTLTFRRTSTTTVKMIGEVWRYRGVAGGANEFINRGVFALSLPNGTASASTAVSGVVTEADCVPILIGWTNDTTSTNDYNDCSVAVDFGSGNVSASRQGTNGNLTVYVQVIEFTGSNWTVAKATSSNHDAGAETVTLSQSIGNWSNAWIEASSEGDTSETGLSDVHVAFYPGGSATEVICNPQFGDNNARNDGTAIIYAISNPDIVVTHDNVIGVSEGNGSYGAPVSLASIFDNTTLNTKALSWYPDTSGTGTAWARGSLGAKITSVGTNAPTTGTGGPEEGYVPQSIYNQGDDVTSDQYNSSEDLLIGVDITFAATPSGAIYEAGGSGTGCFVGFNSTTGDFVARWGDGGSLTTSGAARLVIPSTTFDFGGRTGRLWVQFDVSTGDCNLWFTENGDADYTYTASVTAASLPSNWSGGDDGGIGFSAGTVAGPEVTNPATFNGTISELRFYNGTLISGGASTLITIDHWVHRSGNNVDAAVAVIDFNDLDDQPAPASTGDLAATESGLDVASFSGTASVSSSGSLAAAETGSDTASLSAGVAISATAAAAEAGTDTASFGAASSVAGSLAGQDQGQDAATGNGSLHVQGALSATESGTDTASAAATVEVSATLAATEAGADAASLSGASAVGGALNASEIGADVSQGTASVLIAGQLSVAESGSDTADLSGGVVPQSGGMAAVESGADVLQGTASVSVSGTLATSEAGTDTPALGGTVQVAGSLAATESGSDTAQVDGSLGTTPTTGTLNATESGADTASLSGTVPVSGTVAPAEGGPDTAAIAGCLTIVGGLDYAEQGSDTAAIAAKAVNRATVTLQEAGADLAGFSGATFVTGALAANESGADTAAATGVLVGLAPPQLPPESARAAPVTVQITAGLATGFATGRISAHRLTDKKQQAGITDDVIKGHIHGKAG